MDAQKKRPQNQRGYEFQTAKSQDTSSIKKSRGQFLCNYTLQIKTSRLFQRYVSNANFFLYFGKYSPLQMKNQNLNPPIYFSSDKGRAINKQAGKRVARLSISREKKYKSVERRNTNQLRKEIQINCEEKHKSVGRRNTN